MILTVLYDSSYRFGPNKADKLRIKAKLLFSQIMAVVYLDLMRTVCFQGGKTRADAMGCLKSFHRHTHLWT